MGKDSNKHLVDQPILQQILDLVPREVFDKLVLAHDSDRYYKTFDSWTHFVTLTGKSVVEFILSYRLRRAAKFLVESNMNIQQAMYAVGIESQSYFTKSFKKEFNMLPSTFVQKHKEDM